MEERYHIFGLTVKSEISLPELIRGSSEPDVFIRLGAISEPMDKPYQSGVCFDSSPNKFILKVNGIACYKVENGETITIDREEGGSDEEIRLFLLGSAFGALIQQRGMLPFHGSAILVENTGVIFSGMSGAGKSTLAAGFVQRGYKLLADDVCVISLDEKNNPVVHPGYPQMKLWSDALENMGHKTKPLRSIRGNLKKYAFPVETEFYNHPVLVKGIYVISPNKLDAVKIEELSGVEKFNAVNHNTYRLNFLKGSGTTLSHFKHVEAIANHCFVKRLQRLSKGFYIEELIKVIEDDVYR